VAATSGSVCKVVICALSMAAFVLVGCVKPPVREMGEAQRNLDEARAKGLSNNYIINYLFEGIME
jgi:hypothetical protein